MWTSFLGNRLPHRSIKSQIQNDPPPRRFDGRSLWMAAYVTCERSLLKGTPTQSKYNQNAFKTCKLSQ